MHIVIWVLAGKEQASWAHVSWPQAKQLLKRYGSAYLITSISFAIVSFAACYALVSSGAPCVIGSGLCSSTVHP
jgi:Protein of unknown function (DUF1279)